MCRSLTATTDTSYFSSKPVSQRSLALDLESSRRGSEVVEGYGGAAPLSPVASLPSSRSHSRAGSKRVSARRRSLRQAMAEPSGASWTELRGLRGATLSHSSGGSSTSRASLAGGGDMAVETSSASAVMRAAAEVLQRQASNGSGGSGGGGGAQPSRFSSHQRQGPARSSTVLSSDDLPAGDPRYPLLADDLDDDPLSAARPGGCCADVDMADTASLLGSSAGSHLGEEFGSGGGSSGFSDEEGGSGTSSQNLEALRDQYDHEFSEFDQPVDVAALRSLTASPERPHPTPPADTEELELPAL